MFTEFLQFMKYGRKCSKNTLKNYKILFKKFEKFLDGKEITLPTIRRFQVILAKNNLQASTINMYLKAIKSYLSWAFNDKSSIDPHQVKLLRTVPPKIEYLNKEELQRFFSAIEVNDRITLRDKTMLELLYVSGMRVSEMINLNCSHIDLVSKEILITGKGGNSRTVFFDNNHLEEYMKTRNDSKNPLFLSYKRTKRNYRISNQLVNHIIRKYSQKANIRKRITAHSLRRSFATNLHLNGCPMKAISNMLGHKHVTTTELYIRFADPEIKSMHKKYLIPIS